MNTAPARDLRRPFPSRRGGRAAPRGESRCRWFWHGALALGAGLLAACGVPGPPLPPLLEILAPVSNLSAVQIGHRVRLAWAPPRLTTEGTRARRLDRIEVFGAFLPSGAPLSSFAEQSRRLAILPALEIPAEQAETVQEFDLEPSQIGQQAFFAVKAINDQGKDAGFSNQVSLQISNLPEPPSDLEALVTETAIRLQWKPAERSAFGGPPPVPGGYEVYRADAATPAAGERIGTAASLSFEDTSFTLGQRYVYSVRAFVRTGESVAVTPHSAALAVIAADRFPPKAPQNVRAIAVPGAVELSWSPGTEADLAGYTVYRSAGGAFQKLHSELLTLPLFRDATITPAARYRYQVTATDNSGNESPPSEELALTAE